MVNGLLSNLFQIDILYPLSKQTDKQSGEGEGGGCPTKSICIKSKVSILIVFCTHINDTEPFYMYFQEKQQR